MLIGFRYLHVVELAHFQFLVAHHQHFVVNFGGVLLGATDIIFAFCSVDKHTHYRTDACLVLFQRYMFLYLHDFVHPTLFFILVYGVAPLVCCRPFFGRIGKDTQSREPLLSHKIFQLFELLVALPGVTYYQCCSYRILPVLC